MICNTIRDKKRIFIILISFLTTVLSLLSIKYTNVYAKTAGNYTDDDFHRNITIDLDGGTANLGWCWVLDSSPDVIHYTSTPFLEGNEPPIEGTFHEHANCRGMTPYIKVTNPSKANYQFNPEFSSYRNYQNDEHPLENVLNIGGAYYFEAGCYINNSQDIYLRLGWEPNKYNVDVNCYYWDDAADKWVNQTSGFSYVKVNHDNSNNWNTDDFFGVSYGSNYTVYAKPVEGWQIVGWSDVESAKNESTPGEDLIKTPGLYTSTSSSSWTGTMNTITPGIYNSTETISVFVKKNKYTLTFDPDGGTLKNPGSNLYNPEWNNGNSVTVTTNTGNFCSMSDDCPTRTGYTFTGWYRAYWKADGSLDHLEQIYNSSGKAVESSLWGYWDNNWHYKYAGNETLWAGWTKNDYSLDLNIVYGGKKLCSTEEILPYIDGFDVYIDGNLVAENVPDYCGKVPYESTYEFKNFRMKPGYVFTNNGSLSGTVGAKENEAVAYVYDNNALAYYDGNGATGGQDVATGGKDYFVYYNMRYNYSNENGNASTIKNLFTKNNYSFVNYKTENGNYRKVGENIDPGDNSNAKAVIKSAYNNDLVFNIAGNIYADGTNICLWWNDCYNESNYWSFLPSEDGYFFIVNNYSGMFLDLVDGNAYDLANVQLCHLNWSYSQQWKLIPAGDGYYYIASRCNENYRLDAQGGSQNSNAGQNVCVYHAADYDGQKWKIDFLNREDYFQVQWTPAIRLTEYYGNGDNNNFSYFKSLQATDDNIADINRFKRIGYTFTGYNTSADSSGRSYKENDVIDKTDCQGITLIRNRTDYNIAVKQNNSTLYAQQADYEMAQWWSFIKADNAQAYYIMNMSTGQALYSSSGEVKAAALDKNNSAFMWDLELVDVHEYKISVHNKNEYLTMRSDNSIYVDSKYSDTESSYDYQVWNIDGISSALYAQWKPNPDTPYVVKHWKEKLYIDGTTQYANASEHNETNYFLADTDNLKGTTDSLVTPGVKNYEGFTAPEAQTVIIKPDGSLVVNYYYTRNTYKLGGDDSSGNSTSISTKNGIESASGAGAYKYEEPVTVSAEVKTGYHWHTSGCNCETDLSKYPTGWYSVNSSNITTFISGSSYDTQTMKFTMPAHNVYLAVRATNNSYYINFNSNGGNGSMDKIKAVYDEDIKLPKNTFTRSTPEGESKFLNWYDNNNTYADEETVKNLTSKLNDTVTLFVKWDDCPVITAIDRYFTLDNAQTGKITYDSLMSTATVTDDNDNPEDIIFEIIDYSERDFTTLTNNAVISVTYRATDSAVNSTVKMILVHIVSTEAEKVENTKYVRSISENYYDKPYEDGGLEPDSIWRTNSEYAETLKKAMDNRASITYDVEQFRVVFADFPYYNYGNMSCDHIEQEWTFTHDDIKKVQTYVDTYGLGNIYDANNLQRFIEEFSYCKNY